MDETLSIGAQAVFALSDEMQGQQREIQRLQHELNAAYRASSLASADAVDAARREAEVADARADSQQRKAEARERELEAQLIAAHEQLVEAQRAGYAVQRGAERATASGRILDQRLQRVREAAKAVMEALPPSAAEVAQEEEVLVRTAAGAPPDPSDAPDEMTLLARALERAGRCTEQNRACVAEAQMLRTELQAEKAALAFARDERQALAELHRVSQEEKVVLRRELAEAHDARESAEEAAKRFQALLQVGIEHAGREVQAGASVEAGVSGSIEAGPSVASASVRSPLAAAGAANATAAVEDLEAAVREAAELTALLARPVELR